MQRLTLFTQPVTVFSPYDTPLHQIVSQCHSVSDVENYIGVVGKAITAVQAKIGAEEKDNLPIELVAHNKSLSDIEKETLYNLLAPFTFPDDIKPFHEPINLDDVKKNFPPEVDIRLLAIACDVCNQVRKKINIVPTHPHIKSQGNLSWSKAYARLTALREETNNALMRFLLNNKNIKISSVDPSNPNEIAFTVPKDLLKEYYEIVTWRFIEAGIANCAELALIAMQIFYKDYPDIQFGGYLVENGDHEFLMLNISLTAPLYFTTHTLLVDPWSGHIIPADVFKLKNYKRLALDFERRNCVMYFNKNQSIAPFCVNGTTLIGLPQKEASYFIEHYLKDPRELLTYKLYVEGNLVLALNKKLVTKHELVNYGDRMNFLKEIFSHPNIIELLEGRKVDIHTLAAIEENKISAYLTNLIKSPTQQSIFKTPTGMFNGKKRLLLTSEDNQNPQKTSNTTSL